MDTEKEKTPSVFVIDIAFKREQKIHPFWKLLTKI
jgi:hypothetical protein